ncbi:hypothetical protein C6988_10125 [Nitrosopumilus sp. b1]|uniref:hypothetical protein n=1 Tax=Nitrosopumilus sp. b1 TaxID=2109907 RepID=UPI0015F7624A|nr:hypothetical protein [Nitrosopumilus sp. b1]KAF6242149.1 hypothetical protein C6988_10125 [Nitrosopumilus sp. b1]
MGSKLSRPVLMAMLIVGVSVAVIFTITPWNWTPIQVTEDVTVLAVTEYGCVAESQYGTSVVVSECNAKVGDVVSATFYIPSSEVNEFYDKQQQKVELVQPEP